MEIRSILLRRTPIMIAGQLVLANIVATGIYGLAILGTPDPTSDFHLIAIGSLMSVQTIATVSIVLRWAFTMYIVEPGDVILRRGILTTREQRYSLRNIESISLRQSILGKLLGYGTIHLKNPLLHTPIAISHVTDPERQIAVLEAAMESAPAGMPPERIILNERR